MSTRGEAAIPMLSYEDVEAAMTWLCDAFGFREVGPRFGDDGGRVTHAELALDGATVFLGWPGPSYMDPVRHVDVCAFARAWSSNPWVIDGVFVTVSDVDAHCERARRHGASILREPEDGPAGRLYTAADPYGHRWMFSERATDA